MFLLCFCVKKNVHSNKFVDYICLQVLPVLSDVVGSSATTAADVQLELVKLLAEMVGFVGDSEHNDECTVNVFSRLLVRISIQIHQSAPLLLLLLFT